jgi:hypothetical protein
MPADADFDPPRHNRVACQLCSVVAQNRFGFAARGNQMIELTRVSAAGRRDIGDRSQALSRAFFVDAKNTEAASADN